MKSIIEEIRNPNEPISVRESILGSGYHMSSITIRPEIAASEVRNALVSYGNFENVRFSGDNTIEIMFNGKWYDVKVSDGLGNLFI